MAVNSRNPDRLTQFAFRLRRFLTALVLVLATVIIAERATYAGVFGTAPALAGSGNAAVAIQILLSTPAMLYLAALWYLRQAAAAAASGGPFGTSVVKSLKRVGFCLVGGSVLALFAVPLIFSLGSEQHIRLIDHDVATLIIAAIGLALVFIGQLIDRAAKVEAELEQMF